VNFFDPLLSATKVMLPVMALTYVALMPAINMTFYNNLLFFPSSAGDLQPAQPLAGVPVQSLFIDSPGQPRIHAWWLPVPNARLAVLLSHGNAGNLTDRSHLISRLIRCGVSVFAYDYPGYGLSHGQATIENSVAAGEAAYRYMRETLHLDARQIVLFGESLGTGVSCQLASNHPCAAIILQSPFTSLADVGRVKYLFLRLYPDVFFPRQRLDSLAFVKQSHPPLLILHGARDNLIPLQQAQMLYENACGPKQLVVLPDGCHNDLCTVDERQWNDAVKSLLQQAASY
jgi:hypothetical protein